MTNRLAPELDNIVARTESCWEDLRGGRVLITGATGFFGCWLLESFAWANQRLNLKAQAVALARNEGTFSQRLPHLVQDPFINFHAADVRRDGFPYGQFSHVVHAATESGGTLNNDDPLAMFETIVEGTRRTLEFSVASSVRRFLLVSSGAVYGPQPADLANLDESFHGGPDPLNRSSAYPEGKRAAEMLCALAASPSFSPAIARCFAFVGPYMRLDAHFAIGNFILDVLRGEPIRVKGDGAAVRSYLYALDLMVWLWTILFKGQPARAYNVGSEDAVTISGLAHEVAAALSARPGLEAQVSIATRPAAGTPVHRYVPSTARAREELGLQAEIPLREAIRRTHNWFSHQTTT
jgi:nucleoside-diphosphate-sugar epimerase